MDALLACLGNWKTTLLGFVAGVALYVVANGVKMPGNKQEWWTFAFAAIVAGLGLVAKDATTGSRPKMLLLPILAMLTGCAGVADVVKALGQDEATVCVQVNTIYGTARVARTNIVNGNVQCNSEGMTVKSDPQAIGVPIQVLPQIQIGAPVILPAPK